MTNLFFRVCELSIRDNSSKDYTKYYMKDFVPKKIILNTHWTVHPVFGPFVSKYRKFHVEDVRKLCRSGHHDSSSLVDNYFSPKCFVYRGSGKGVEKRSYVGIYMRCWCVYHVEKQFYLQSTQRHHLRRCNLWVDTTLHR